MQRYPHGILPRKAGELHGHASHARANLAVAENGSWGSGELQWTPDGRALWFVSSEGVHVISVK